MDMTVQQAFQERWRRFFGEAELPLGFYYTDAEGRGEILPPQGRACIIADLAEARQGRPLAFAAEDVKCAGGRRYLGFSQTLRPNFAHFLSCGIPGTLEGERYKKTPELVTEHLKRQPSFTAPGRFAVFKRWDLLQAEDNPAVIIFFASPDVLAGLFTLANFDEKDPHGVIVPFGSGCSAIMQYPYQESLAARPRAVLGMFDVSARPFVPADRLTLAVPWRKFVSMGENMEESFLITGSWEQVRRRIARGPKPERP